MATTRLIPMHVIKGQTIANTVHQRISYAINPDKTNNGELVSAYGCQPETAIGEMLLCKKEYADYIGRSEEKKSDIILYQIRQSFKPGEISPEKAQEIGYELARRFTKGQYQFVVATHTDHAHIHNHIIFNSTSMDHTKKFRNFLGSSEAVRKISDLLCLENGLSIIENPQRGSSHYGKWLGDNKPVSWQEKLRQTIDDIMTKKSKSFEEFLKLMVESGYEYKEGQYLSFKAEGQQRFTRLRSLGAGYSEEEIRAAILSKTVHVPRTKGAYRKPTHKVSLLIDVQAKLSEGKGVGYERWAKVFNLKQMAKTLNFLEENDIHDYETLVERAKSSADNYHKLSQEIKVLEQKITEASELRKHIINYSKTKDIYTAYRQSGFSVQVYEENIEAVLIHQAAKKAFDNLETSKIPSVKTLQAEYNDLRNKQKNLAKDLKLAREKMKEATIAKDNAYKMLRIINSEKKKFEKSR